MPSKNGFGNTRTPMTKKVGYGSAMHYKNPVKLTQEGKNKIMASDANLNFKAAIKNAPLKEEEKDSTDKTDFWANAYDSQVKSNKAKKEGDQSRLNSTGDLLNTAVDKAKEGIVTKETKAKVVKAMTGIDMPVEDGEDGKPFAV